MATAAYRAWNRAGRPWKVAAPIKAIGDRLRGYGYTIYYLGSDDASHLQAAKPQDHCPFSVTGWPDAHPYPYVTAMDIMPPHPGSGLPSLQQLGAQLVADKLVGHTGVDCLKYLNWEPDRDNGGRCWQDSFKPNHARANSGDRGHIHFSGRSDMVTAAGSAVTYDPVARIRNTTTPTGRDDDMADVPQQDWANLDFVAGRALRDGISPLPAGAPTPGARVWIVDQIRGIKDAVADIKAAQATPVPVAVDAAAVAAALAANTTFLAAVANAVADENARRQQA